MGNQGIRAIPWLFDVQSLVNSGVPFNEIGIITPNRLIEQRPQL